jgi:hypothetical protein
MDILIWQRIFEANEVWDLGLGVYHWGWFQALFGFMALGFLLFHPHVRRMVTFPLSLGIIAFSGLEDILYYWLDGKHIPAVLPWLNSNPLLLKPVTVERLLISAVFWVLVVVALDLVGEYYERKSNSRVGAKQPQLGNWAAQFRKLRLPAVDREYAEALVEEI